MTLSKLVGWAADRRIPRRWREPVYRAYARMTGAELAEARPPLDAYPSLGAFFVRRLVEGARPLCGPEFLPSPADGRLQALDRIASGQVLQAKGRRYGVRELLGGVGAEVELEGGTAWTIYLSPRDYHRVHSPARAELSEASWIQGARFSVAPAVLDRRMVLPVNERVAMRLETERGPILLVMVGALNVGRVRVLGLAPGHRGALARRLPFERGAELARFEMGSTVVLIVPPRSWSPLPGLAPGAPLKLGEAIGARDA